MNEQEPTFFQIPWNLLPQGARIGPISAIYRGYPENNKLQERKGG